MKTKIVIALLLLVLMGASGFWSYRAGLAASQEATVVMVIPIIQKQHECLASGDTKCLEVTNALLVASTAGQVRALLDSGMPHVLGAQAKEYLEWAKTVVPRK
jgi:2C-methyl-D-erythritol 2,4-cyclodiphosphate synthase